MLHLGVDFQEKNDLRIHILDVSIGDHYFDCYQCYFYIFFINVCGFQCQKDQCEVFWESRGYSARSQDRVYDHKCHDLDYRGYRDYLYYENSQGNEKFL